MLKMQVKMAVKRLNLYSSSSLSPKNDSISSITKAWKLFSKNKTSRFRTPITKSSCLNHSCCRIQRRVSSTKMSSHANIGTAMHKNMSTHRSPCWPSSCG